MTDTEAPYYATAEAQGYNPDYDAWGAAECCIADHLQEDDSAYEDRDEAERQAARIVQAIRQTGLVITSHGLQELAAEAATARERERCAQIAKVHRGSAAKTRLARGQKLGTMDPEDAEIIRAEERGEDIAAEIIERNIRNLTQEGGDHGSGGSTESSG